jgi:hypothetical protein
MMDKSKICDTSDSQNKMDGDGNTHTYVLKYKSISHHTLHVTHIQPLESL